MARLQIPKTSDFILKLCKQDGVTPRKSQSPEEMEKKSLGS